MKLILVSILVSVLFFSPKKKNKKPLFSNAIEIYKDSIWIHKTEVSNLEYLTFLNSNKKENKNEFQLSDSLWKRIQNNTKNYASYYSKHPAYSNYPVVNISKKQAIAFCKWKTDELNQEFEEKLIPIKVKVRLPSLSEWERGAYGKLPQYSKYPWQGVRMRKEKGKNEGMFNCNFRNASGKTIVKKKEIDINEDITTPVNSFFCNTIGLYNMSGNVSEVILDKPIAVGGNWSSLESEVKIKSSIPFLQPSPKVGFRYVIEILK